MAQSIDVEKARKALTECGYTVDAISQINEGSNHYVFDVTLAGGKPAICKFARVRETEEGLSQENKDTLFGGTLSLGREAYLFRMIRQQANVPTPEVYGVHDSPYGKFILLERMSGISQKECMVQSGYSKKVFLDSMKYLGRDFARIQNITFPSFGNIMEDSVIEPSDMTNFSDRFLQVVDMRLLRCHQKEVFTPSEQTVVTRFYHEKLEALRPYFDKDKMPPVLVFTDMHAENFFTDTQGVPTGYFDLESAQAAPAALEFYGFRFFLYNFYDHTCFEEAEKAFFDGYQEAGGKNTPSSVSDFEAIDFLAGCRLLELAQSYWGYIDGIRDTWGQDMKDLLFHYMDTGVIDYDAIGRIWRQRDKQPVIPARP